MPTLNRPGGSPLLYALVGVLLSTTFYPVAGGAQAAQSRLVEVSGRKLSVMSAALESRRPGQPIVILENGLGATLQSWNPVFAKIAEFGPVVAYDRAGMGNSDLGIAPPSPRNVALNLHELLKTIGAAPPYVLVGWSWGGVLIRSYAGFYPDEVVGLVYIDGTEPTLTTQQMLSVFKQAGATNDDYAAMLKADADAAATEPAGVRAESEQFDAFIASDINSRELRAAPEVPTAVLIASRYTAPNPPYKLSVDFEKIWSSYVRSRVQRLSQSTLANREATLVLGTHTAHYMHGDDPALVIESIRRVVFPDAVRRLRRETAGAGTTRLIEAYRMLKSYYPPERFGDGILNRVGYELLGEERTVDAIAVFELNAREHPEVANVYDSLGDAYLAARRLADARRSYARAVALAEKQGLANVTYFRENLRKAEKEK